jgi:hypothetical protein
MRDAINREAHESEILKSARNNEPTRANPNRKLSPSVLSTVEDSRRKHSSVRR